MPLLYQNYHSCRRWGLEGQKTCENDETGHDTALSFVVPTHTDVMNFHRACMGLAKCLFVKEARIPCKKTKSSTYQVLITFLATNWHKCERISWNPRCYTEVPTLRFWCEVQENLAFLYGKSSATERTNYEEKKKRAGHSAVSSFFSRLYEL